MYKVLIADEDEASRDLLAQALSIDDYQIEVFSRGEGVLRRIAAGGVDVLITEVHLPDMPAWDLIAKVHRIDRRIAVIAVTVDESWETSRRVRIESGPVFFYALKPLDLREMQQVVRLAVEWAQRPDNSPRKAYGGRYSTSFQR